MVNETAAGSRGVARRVISKLAASPRSAHYCFRFEATRETAVSAFGPNVAAFTAGRLNCAYPGRTGSIVALR
jgi:hypothetical protein